jgi:hypothetical protein
MRPGVRTRQAVRLRWAAMVGSFSSWWRMKWTMMKRRRTKRKMKRKRKMMMVVVVEKEIEKKAAR